MSNKLTNRIKSFTWRLGGLVVVSILSFLIEPDTIAVFQEAGVAVPAVVIAIGALILGEVTKALNSKQ